MIKNLELARRYWNNEDNLRGEKPIVETLVDGKIKVIEIMKENKKDLDLYEERWINNKEKYLSDMNNKFSGKTKDLLIERVELFYK